MSENQITRFRLVELLVLHETPALDRLRTTYSTSLNDCLYVFAVKYGYNPDYQLYRGYDDDLCCNFLCRMGEEDDTRKQAIIELPDGTIRLFKHRENAAGVISGIHEVMQRKRELEEYRHSLKIIAESVEADKQRFALAKRESRKRLSRRSLRPGCRAANRIYQNNLQLTGK